MSIEVGHAHSGQQVLFIGPGRLGDGVISASVLASAVARWPDARLTVACGPLAAELFRDDPAVDTIHVLRKQPRHGHWRGLWAATVGTRWHAVVDLRNSVVSRLLIARRRFVHHASGSEGVGRKADQLAHVLQVDNPPFPRVVLAPERRERMRREVPASGAVLALGLSAGGGHKVWPVDRYAALAAALTGDDGLLPGAAVLMPGGPDDVPLADALRAALPNGPFIEAMGQPILDQAALVEQADLYVGNDSGFMHIAAAMGVPTLGLFGPSDASVYGPFGPVTATAVSPEPWRDLLAAAAVDGFRESRMTGLEVSTVAAAATALLSDQAAAACGGARSGS